MTQPEPEERPRSWLPLIIAGSLALLVVAGVIVSHLVRVDLSPQKRAAADACDAQYAKQFPDGPGISGGDIYSSTEWRDLDATLVRLGVTAARSLTGEQSEVRDTEAAALVSAGGDTMTIVWQRDDESHAQCVAEMKGDTVALVKVTGLATPNASPTPTPSPS